MADHRAVGNKMVALGNYLVEREFLATFESAFPNRKGAPVQSLQTLDSPLVPGNVFRNFLLPKAPSRFR